MFELFDPLMMLAQAAGEGTSENVMTGFFRSLFLALVFSALGMGLLAAGFFVLAKLLPFSLRKEIEEDQNTALAILISSFVLGLSLIIAAAIMG